MFYYYGRLPELQTMRSFSGDPLQATIHHRYTLVFRLPTRLFSSIKREKPRAHASPRAIENSVSVLSALGPSATATKDAWVQNIVPVESGPVSNACATPTGKDKSQHLVIPIRITISDRWCSRLSTLIKSGGKGTPPASGRFENDRLPLKQRRLTTGTSGINGSSVCATKFSGGKDFSHHTPSSGRFHLQNDADRPPDYNTVMPKPRGSEKDQGAPGGDAVAKASKISPPFSETNNHSGIGCLVRKHSVSLGTNPTAGTDTCTSIPGCGGKGVIEGKKGKGSLNENADDCTTSQMGEAGRGLDVALRSTLTPALSSASLEPIYEVEVRKVSRQPVVESNFLHFYSTVKPYIVQRKLPSRLVERVPRPIDNGPLPESDGFRVLEGPFTTPAGGTSTPELLSAPPTNGGVLPEKDPGIKRADLCMAPVIAAPARSTSRQLICQPIAPPKFSDEVLKRIMTWDLDMLHARTGFSQTLSSALRSAQGRWQILKFDLAFETSDASVLCDDYNFPSKPSALQLPCPSPRITELDDESEPALHKATGEVLYYGGEGSGGGSTQAARQGSGSRANFQQSRSAQHPRGKKRANGDEDDDRKGKKKERRQEPPVGDEPSPHGSDDEGVFCPYWVRDRRNCKKKSCISRKKNLSKLKEHLRRVHFLHLGCPIENCTFHAGDKFQIKRHQKTAHVGQAELEPIPRTTDSKFQRKNRALAIRNLTWDQIYDICFREEPEGPDGAFESEGEEDEEGEDINGEDDDEDHEGHEGCDDHEAHEGQAEYRSRYTSDPSSAAAVEESHRENLIPPNPFEPNQSMFSNGAPTIPDTPELASMNDESFSFDPSKTHWYDDQLGGFRQSEDLPPSPAPDHGNPLNFQQPHFSNPGFIPWETIEKRISTKFEDFRRTYSEALRNRHGTSPKTVQQYSDVLIDIERVFSEIQNSARLALRLPDGGSGSVSYFSRGSFSREVPPASQGSIPLNLSTPQTLFQDQTDFVGGNNSTIPSLTNGTWSSSGPAPSSLVAQDSHLGGLRAPGFQYAMASGSQAVCSGMPRPQTRDSPIRGPCGLVLAHMSSGGDWSVGDGPLGMQPSFDISDFPWEAEGDEDGEGEKKRI